MMTSAPTRSRLPDASEEPLAAQLCVNLLVGNGPTCFLVRLATGDGLHDVQMVLHVIETAIVRETIQERADSVFGSHSNLNQEACVECSRMILIQPSPCSHSRE